MNPKGALAKPWFVLVGGFLGAGKTTLLLAAAKELHGRGLRSAVILNDQGDALVDSSFAQLNGLNSGEVTGGCFCCRFSDLVDVIESLDKHCPHVIFAEPVGSCTDLSATVLGPLRAYGGEYQLAPYTVLVDPMRAKVLLGEDADPNLRFLFEAQLNEADLVCMTKSELHAEVPDLPGQNVRRISAKTGEGVAAWLDEVLSGTLSAGNKTLDIDYEQYARAEAALAWLNLHVTWTSPEPIPAAMVLGPLLDRLDTAFTAADISIVHLKGVASSPHGYLKAAICRNGEQPVVEGAVDFSSSITHDVLLNLRAIGEAERVRHIVEQEVAFLNPGAEDCTISCFHPAAPKPERRTPALL